MKSNLVYATLTALLLSGCSQDDVILQTNTSDSAIGFSTFVDKASRAETTTTENLETFKVWGTKFREGNDNAVRIMDGTVVSRSGDNWVYSPKKYWVNENAYSFTAIGSTMADITGNYLYMPPAVEHINYTTYLTHYMGQLVYNNSNEAVSVKNGTANVSLQGANGGSDIVWASTKIPTLPAEGAGPASVNFTFGHLLSRVNLKFVNNRTIENPAVKIKNVYVESAATGSIDFGAYTAGTPSTDFKWSYSSSKFDCNFAFPAANAAGNPEYNLGAGASVTTLDQFIIPSQASIKVSFDCYTSVTTEDGADGHINISKTIKFGDEGSPYPFEGIELKPGYSYTLVAYLTDNLDNAGSIKIAVVVNEYIENSSPAYAMSFAKPSLFKTEATDEFSYLYQTISVDQLSYVNELVYYGQSTNPIDVTDFSNLVFKWSIPKNTNYSFDSSSGLKGNPICEKTYSSVSSIDDLRIDLFVYKGYSPNGKVSTNSGTIPVTLTMMDTEGNILLSGTVDVPVTYTGATTGGSQDGDDNDG